MKALVFAAGLGTRLKPFTLEHPKALVPVGHAPMLERVIAKLINAGVDEIVVNVHHFAQQIIDFLRERQNYGITIHISDESSQLLDTGGGILRARQWLEGRVDGKPESFIVHNADILTDFDIQQMWQQHIASDALATLLVADRKTSRYLLFDHEDRMRGWTNANTGEVLPAGLDAAALTPLAFGGVHVVSSRIFPLLEAYATDPVFPIMPFYIQACADNAILGYQPQQPYRWLDVGKPESLAQAEELFG